MYERSVNGRRSMSGQLRIGKGNGNGVFREYDRTGGKDEETKNGLIQASNHAIWKIFEKTHNILLQIQHRLFLFRFEVVPKSLRMYFNKKSFWPTVSFFC